MIAEGDDRILVFRNKSIDGPVTKGLLSQVSGEATQSTKEARILKMVLADRIELSTSPLPRECSTTELRQQAGLNAAAKTKRPWHALSAMEAREPQAGMRLANDRKRRYG